MKTAELFTSVPNMTGGEIFKSRYQGKVRVFMFIEKTDLVTIDGKPVYTSHLAASGTVVYHTFDDSSAKQL